VAVIATFSRMRALTTDIEPVLEAIRTSEHLKLDSAETMVKRIAPLPEDDVSVNKTIYAKGFPAEEGFTIEDVQGVFDKCGKVICVRLRRHADKKQKPSCFVEFATPDDAQAAAKAHFKFKDHHIEGMMKADYHTKKKEEKEEATPRPKNEEKGRRRREKEKF